MNSQDYRNLQEAYLNVYQELDEAVYGGEPKKAEEPKDTRLVVTNADKKGNTPAYQNFKKGDKRYKAADHMGEETRELDEVRGGGKIDAVANIPSIGERGSRTSTDAGMQMPPLERAKARANALKRRNDPEATKRANRINSRFVNPTNSAINRSLLAATNAKHAEKTRLQKLNNSYDLYDLVLSHLLDEGYADTNENALVIMANMSEEWRESILTEVSQDEFRAGMMKAAAKMPSDVRTPSREELFGSKEERSKVKLPKGVVNPTPDTSANIRKSSEYSSPRASRGLPAAGYN